MRWFNTPHDLYISGEFKALRRGLMHDRVDAMGILRCEHCGKPILQSYDCIAHHVTEVTTANLNNPEITLNPENIKLVHHKCHNEIHARFGYTIRKVYFIWGSPCSGKNTYVNANKGHNDIIVDVDAIWQAITGGEKYFKPDALKTNVFMLRDALLEQIKTRAGKWQTAYIISGEPRKAARERLCASLGAEPIYIDCTKENALQHLANDPERKNYVQQWTQYIDNFFNNVEL